MKASIKGEFSEFAITGRSLHLSSGPVNLKNKIVKIIFCGGLGRFLLGGGKGH